jgi:hypothetical protein
MTAAPWRAFADLKAAAENERGGGGMHVPTRGKD